MYCLLFDDVTIGVFVVCIRVLTCSSLKYFLWKCWWGVPPFIDVLVGEFDVEALDDDGDRIKPLSFIWWWWWWWSGEFVTWYSITVEPPGLKCNVDVGVEADDEEDVMWLRFLLFELLLL